MRFLSYDSKFSRIMTRISELVLLNFVFILTSLPLVTIGASISAMYSICLKMARNEEGHIIKGYFKGFVENFKQASIFWLFFLMAYSSLYIIYLAAYVNGLTMAKIYLVLCSILGFQCFLFFFIAFPLLVTFQNNIKGIISNALSLEISNFPKVFTASLIIIVPVFISFGINTRIMEYALLFWILIGFSVVIFFTSFYLNKIFEPYMKMDKNYVAAGCEKEA